MAAAGVAAVVAIPVETLEAVAVARAARVETKGASGNERNDPFGRQNDPFGQQRRQQQRPVFLSGAVLLDDGNPPPESVTIRRICNGRNVPETYSDRKGRFSFQLGGDMSLAMSDASSSGVPGGRGGAFGGQPGGLGGAGAGNFTGPGTGGSLGM